MTRPKRTYCRKVLSYSVTEYPKGVVIHGPVPVTLLCRIIKHYSKRFRAPIVDQVIAFKLNAVAVITTKTDSADWRYELGLRLDDPK